METYENIKENIDSYFVKDNIFECPICKSHRSKSGFLQHVKSHFYSKNITNFIQANKDRGIEKHIDCINKYNENPNVCLFCNKKIIAKDNDSVRRIKIKKFCSKSCSVSFSNKNRKHNEKTRNKISNSLKTKNYDVKCINCNRSFRKIRDRNKFCSKKCFIEYKFVILSREMLEKEIIQFIEDNGFVPTSKHNRNWSHFAKKYFGTWNNLIEHLGYESNNQKYCKKILPCKDGHIADSISEKTVDDWLFENQIRHDRRKKYPNSYRDCDFYLTDYDIWLEYFGLAGELDEYDDGIEEKGKICLENGFKLIGIYPKDLYPKNNLSTVLSFLKNNDC